MGYTIQEKDFVERTIKIIEQYDKLIAQDKTIQEKEKYEVTLLLNCMVGLLILPQQKWTDSLPSDMVTEEEWGIDPAKINILKEENRTINNVAKHIRNCIAHNRFFVFNENKEIDSIWFIDHDKIRIKKGIIEKDTFEVTLSVANLRAFVEKLSSWHLSQMKK